MIRTERGKTEIKGSLTEVECDLSIIIKAFVETAIKKGISEARAWGIVSEATVSAKLTEEQLKQGILEEMKELSEIYEELAKKVGIKGNE